MHPDPSKEKSLTSLSVEGGKTILPSLTVQKTMIRRVEARVSLCTISRAATEAMHHLHTTTKATTTRCLHTRWEDRDTEGIKDILPYLRDSQ